MNNEILDIFKKDDVNLTSKFLIGVSGGPDSMYLLWNLKNLDVIVAHVNYHKRIDSDNDQKIVEEFCKTYNIPLEVLEITSHNEKGNFQAIARQERYDFYRKIYQKYNCNYLLLAHHKDDFIETAIMQEQSNRKPLFYGIAKHNKISGMNIYRPLLENKWKDKIQKFCDLNNIKYAIDSTNDQNIYSRNIIRNNLKKITELEKEKIYSKFCNLNQSNQGLLNIINIEYNKWKETNFDGDWIKNSTHWEKLIFKMINEHFSDIKLSSQKINSIYQFIISSNRTSNYKLNNLNKLIKVKNKLVF